MSHISFYQSLWMFIHMVAVFLLGGIMVGTLMIEKHLRLTADWPSRARLGMLGRNLGMLSPIASGLLLMSGIGNMVTFGYTMSQAYGPAATWLGVKITLFLIAVVNGTVTSIRMGKKRMAIGATVRGGGSSEQGEAALKATFGTMNVFFAVQFLLVIGILFLVVFKPF